MLDRVVSPSKTKLKRCRRRVLALASEDLIRLDIAPAPDPGEGFSMFANISTLMADSIVTSSVEALALDHVRAELPHVSEARKREAIERASVILSPTKADRELIAAAFPRELLAPDEELAVAILGVMVTRSLARFRADTLTAIRRFPPRLRGLVKTLVAAADGTLVRERADLLSATPVGVVDTAAFEVAAGVRDLLKRMKLPKAAAKIKPAGCGPISRFSATTFRHWSHDPQLLGLLDPRSLQQRRQIELVSRIASATLAHTRITAATSDTMIRWCLAAAPELPAGRFGAKYSKLVRWMTDSVAPPRRGLRPGRAWTAKISSEKALLAAVAHAEALRQARKTVSPFVLPDDPPGADDQWPRGGDLGEASLRRLWTLASFRTSARRSTIACRTRRFGPSAIGRARRRSSPSSRSAKRSAPSPSNATLWACCRSANRADRATRLCPQQSSAPSRNGSLRPTPAPARARPRQGRIGHEHWQ